MRFNKKMTCLNFLESGEFNEQMYLDNRWHPAQKEPFFADVLNTIRGYSDLFKKRVQFITQPFLEAALKSVPKVKEILKSEALGTMSGTFICPKSKGAAKTIFYHIESPTTENLKITYLEFSKYEEGPGATCGAAIYYNSDGEQKIYIGDHYEDIGYKSHLTLVAEFWMLLGFLKFCDIETKIIQPNEKYRDHKKTRYFNETKSSIEILDSRWFTEIVRTEGFGVSGHLRLQPYGPGKSMKKWIYISPYEKSGYTVKAKKHE